MLCMHARPELGTSKLATEVFKFAAEEVAKDTLSPFLDLEVNLH